MGNTVSTIIDDADGQRGKRQEAEDALNAVTTMAVDKSTIHYNDVVSNAQDAKSLPLHKIVARIRHIHCDVSRDPQILARHVWSALGGVVKNEMIEGLTVVISQAIEILAGSLHGNQSELQDYAIVLGKNGGIGRIDFYMYYYTYASQTLSDVTQDCLILSLVISSAQTKNLSEHEVKALVDRSYSGRLPGEGSRAVAARKDKLKEITAHGLRKNKGRATF